MPFEENAKLVGMAAFMNTDQAIMKVWLGSGTIEDTLRNGMSCRVSCAVGMDYHLEWFGVHC